MSVHALFHPAVQVDRDIVLVQQLNTQIEGSTALNLDIIRNANRIDDPLQSRDIRVSGRCRMRPSTPKKI